MTACTSYKNDEVLTESEMCIRDRSYPNFMTDDVFMPYEDDMTGGFVSLELPKQHYMRLIVKSLEKERVTVFGNTLIIVFIIIT